MVCLQPRNAIGVGTRGDRHRAREAIVTRQGKLVDSVDGRGRVFLDFIDQPNFVISELCFFVLNF